MANLEAEAVDIHAGETPLVDFSFRINAVALVFSAGLILRLLLALLPGFGVDIGVFRGWSQQLADQGPWNFYYQGSFHDYAPGYMYVLLAIGKLNNLFGITQDTVLMGVNVTEYTLKLPSIAGDMAGAYLLYKLLDTQRMEIRLGAAALYLLFPAALLIGPIWGQVDSLLAFFILLSVYYISKDRPVAGAVAFTIGFLVKPQAIVALPFLAFWIMRHHPPRWSDTSSGLKLPVPPRVWYECAAAGFGVLLLLIIPFFTYKPWDLINQLYNATDVANYRVNSFWAYNFWNTGGLFDWGFKPDVAGIKAGQGEWMGLPDRAWGIIMFVTALIAILVATRRAKGTGMLALGTALSTLAFYLFLTRMHERYVFPFFLPCLAACVLTQSRVLWATFIVLAVVHFFNLYYVYSYYNPNDLRVDSFFNWFEKGNLWHTGLETVQWLSIIMVASFPILIACAYVFSNRKTPAEAA